MTASILRPATGILGILCMWLSFLFAMLVVGDELANSDYRNYGSDWPCSLNTIESQRVYEWSLLVLFMWLLVQGIAMLMYTGGTRKYFDENHAARRGLSVVMVSAAQLYLGGLFLLATHFEWGLTCNNSNGSLHGANFLWGAASLWIVGVVAMHGLARHPKRATAGAIFSAEHLATGAGFENTRLLAGFVKK